MLLATQYFYLGYQGENDVPLSRDEGIMVAPRQSPLPPLLPLPLWRVYARVPWKAAIFQNCPRPENSFSQLAALFYLLALPWFNRFRIKSHASNQKIFVVVQDFECAAFPLETV